LTPGEHVLDLGTGTGAVAQRAAALVSPGGQVTGVDISPEMLALAQQRKEAIGLSNVRLLEGRAENIPADDNTFDVVLACLSLMYVIDRSSAAREIARVLRPGGRLVAAAWGAPEQCDIVLFQQTAGSFAGAPPVPGVGPGALGDPSVFLQQLSAAAIEAHVETETLGFEFPDLLRHGTRWRGPPLDSYRPSGSKKQRTRSWQQCIRGAMGRAAFTTPRNFSLAVRGDKLMA
jgi:SAM-dependent methyltransferase